MHLCAAQLPEALSIAADDHTLVSCVHLQLAQNSSAAAEQLAVFYLIVASAGYQ
jgi:uncharacterized membrane protein